MPTNSEMYERGALDAEHDELNPFYYQHYYYYRRGYDTARRRARADGRGAAPVALVLVLALAVVGGAWWYLGRERAPAQAEVQVAPRPTLALTARPTSAPTAAPTAAARPTATLALVVGSRARVVNLNGSPLRARERPGLGSRVVARIPEGAEVTLRDGPVEADGYTWWQTEAEGAAGWVAGRSPEGTVFLELLP